MLPHQQRVVTEKAELDEKIDKLGTFIGNPGCAELVGNAEYDRLCMQYKVMTEYSLILGERIEAFGEVG